MRRIHPAPGRWRELYGDQAEQQPDWAQHPDLEPCRATLATAPALVEEADVAALRDALATVAVGAAQVLHLGDCAESFAETDAPHVLAKLAVLHGLADTLADRENAAVLRIGRIGGQFAKPRSRPTEHLDGQVLPAFRGHLINSEAPNPAARRHDPNRMVLAYLVSADVLDLLAQDRAERSAGDGPWASHDALVLDYEAALVRTGAAGRFLASTHLPWVGDRTRQPGSAHVRLLADVHNPVACKVGPTTRPEELLAICARLDPDRVPGRLTLIVRLGAAEVEARLPALVKAVRGQGHPVVWLSDPMHGNTRRTEDGRKTRLLEDIVAEAVAFRRVLRGLREHPGGLHLEVAATEVTECVGGPVRALAGLSRRYTTLCDPRLNPAQTRQLLHRWVSA